MRTSLREPNKRDVSLCGLLLFSFFYELPLVDVLPFHRANPRLFDVALLLALFATRWKRDRSNRILIAWETITGIFVVVAIISYIALLPPKYGKISLFFGAKYIQALLAIWVLTGFRWTEDAFKKLFRYFCYGLIFSGTWGFMQLVGVFPNERYLPDGSLIPSTAGAVLATFGTTYFHSGVVGAIGVGVTLSLFFSKYISTLLFLPSFGSAIFLAMFSGSRAALALAVFVVIVIAVRRIKYLLPMVLTTILIVVTPGIGDLLVKNSLSVKRLAQESQTKKNKVGDRIRANYFAGVQRLVEVHGVTMLAVGGGFYSVPMPDRYRRMKYRVGYGFHNIHLFVLEQAGIFAFFAALYFWCVTISEGWRQRRELMARAALGIAAGIVIIGWTGQIFYFGFGTENMVALQVTLLALFLGGSRGRDTNETTSFA